MIRSVHMISCIAAQIRFLLLKGPGSFKTIFKIGGNVDEFKDYRLIPFIPPPPFSFYTTFNIVYAYCLFVALKGMQHVLEIKAALHLEQCD